MRARISVLAGLAIVVLAGASWSAEFSRNTGGVLGEMSSGVPQGGCGAVILTQSTAQTVLAQNSASCNISGEHADNSYFRAYDMSAYPGGFDVCEVQIGIEEATAGQPALGGGASQPMTVNVWANSGVAFPPGTLALVGTAAVNVADQALTVLTVPVAASLPPGTSQMILEVFTPNGQQEGHRFFIGSNNLGQSAPSYIAAADCKLPDPTPTSDIGFPGMQIVLNAVGTPQGGPPIVEVPTLGTWGAMILAGFLASAGFVVLRKRAIV